MNFRTTLVLLIVMVGVGILVLVTGNSPNKPDEPKAEKLLSISSSDVSRVSITSEDGQKIVLEKADGKWKLAEPVKAPADETVASALLDSLTGLTSRGKIAANSSTGMDNPRFKIELTAKDKTVKIDVGSRSGTGDNTYVRLNGQGQADVVPATIYTSLDKPLRQWRREKLFDVSSGEIRQLKVATTQQSFTVEKQSDNWTMPGPTSMPVDSTAVSDLTIAITNLRAVDFVSENSADASKYGLQNPVMSVSFSTQAPATQPSISQPAMTTVSFGRYDDVLKKNVYALSSGTPGVVTVVASTLDSFRKKPLDLRDKKLLTINPEHVNKISITTDKPATTQPTTRAASNETLVLEHTKAVMGPMVPATAPATGPSTTQAATQPTEPPSKWNIASKNGADAEDSKVDQLLSELNPLRVTRYVESAPADAKVDATYTLAVDATDANVQIVLTDPGGSQPLVGMYNGLTFEVSRFLVDRMTGDFTKQPKPAELPPMALPPGIGMP